MTISISVLIVSTLFYYFCWPKEVCDPTQFYSSKAELLTHLKFEMIS